MYAALRGLARFSVTERQRKCRSVPAGSLVAIERRQAQTLRASYGGLQTCGSPWTCPACGPKIAAERAADLAAGLSGHHLAGGQVAMITLTLRHSLAQSLAELLDALTGAWSAIRKDKTYRQLYADLGVIGWVKRLDVTVGENGWHPHLHVLVFLTEDADATDVQALADAMFRPWSRRLVRVGLSAPTKKHGVDAKLLSLDQAHEAVGKYVAATEYAAAGALGAALEVTNPGTKIARGGNRTAMQLLADVVRFGLAEDHVLWREYERATKGRRSMQWSNGLRDRLIPELGDEATDEEAAASSDGLGRLLGLLTKPAWRAIRAAAAEARILEAAEAHTDEDLARVCVNAELAALDAEPLIVSDPDAKMVSDG